MSRFLKSVRSACLCSCHFCDSHRLILPYIFFFIFFITLFTSSSFLFFFFNDTATTEIYTLSLHDALPIWRTPGCCRGSLMECLAEARGERGLVSGHLRAERSQVRVLRAAHGRVQGLQRVGAAVRWRERVAACLEAGVAQHLLALAAEHEVQEQLRGVRAGRSGGDPDAARDQRGEGLG